MTINTKTGKLVIDWKSKLSSRKFWLAVSGVVVSVFLIFTAGGDKTQLITGAVLNFGSLVTFCVADVVQDNANIK